MDHADAASTFGRAQRRLEREQEEGHGMPLSLKVLVPRELTEKRDGHKVGPVALLRLGKDRVARPMAPPNFPSKTAGSSATTRRRALSHIAARSFHLPPEELSSGVIAKGQAGLPQGLNSTDLPQRRARLGQPSAPLTDECIAHLEPP
jgi:hypothetical protein